MARFGDGLATGTDLVSAAERAVQQALAALDAMPDLVCVFVSGQDADEVALAGERAMALSGDAVTIGCSSTGVIGDGRGVENQGAVSVWAAVLPEVTMTPFTLDTLAEDDRVAVVGMAEPAASDRAALLLANPYTFPAQAFVRTSTEALGDLPVVGGLADAIGGRDDVRLFCLGEVVDRGAVGILLGGSGVLGTAVSQGCSPVGPAVAVTRSEDNVLKEIAGTPAYTKLEQIVGSLPPEQQDLVTEGLQVGIAMDEYADSHEHGDFLIRAIVGADPEAGSIVVGEAVDVGQTVRFHVRDRDTAEKDLIERLEAFAEDTGGRAAGALLFSCNGRGSDMFATADHDVRSVRRTLGIDPVGGFFAGGEIGPVSGRNHVHGFTACLLAFTGDEHD
ncbi:FIST N-terminal domain-containing protein [Lipingzhangella sp. LS1_29]|uniref:FIST N-terminal domain-containing protein n=1 Tax=Lipingzhangella rawalii TaxID=2055835 RepID=A0ABU2HBG2_9ACTN|nr:FIST N-terminal domain-containing protein [Lipingzhangella rawalii]MDS1272150.1 FIST N-terminal domain-containing protein [Lipingzhangella rawalii]